MAIIEVKNLVKKYGKFTAVDGISFEVKKGEIFGILGPNGAGKTTTLEMIEGLREINSGEILLDGINVKDNPNDIKRLIGIQLQSSSFFDHLNLKELLTLFGSFYNQKINPMEILAEVELTDKAKSTVKSLSGGQKQRFSIASAMVNDPIVLFLDEPTTGLDPQARRHLWNFIRQIQKKGKTVVLTTHYMEEAEELCDRIAIMDRGKILTLDTPENLIKNLLKTGFKKKKIIQEANMEDVFLNLTGHGLREE
ncbi:MAG: ABC transporter ATP-binding protein [Patescibacteria group bacterium]|nr:ABC transporter ATP-binding protein [Patescibacteria group bacterium]